MAGLFLKMFSRAFFCFHQTIIYIVSLRLMMFNFLLRVKITSQYFIT